MSDEPVPPPCPLCGRPLGTEPTVTVPDLMLEMHEACARRRDEPGPAAR
jgi:hypothetical protein